MNIGRKVYYDKATGNVLQITSEMSGDVVETTQVQDFTSYTALQGIDPNTVGCIQLNFGDYAESFGTMQSVKVDTSTTSLLFTYPPTTPSTPSTPQPALEDRVSSLEGAVSALMGVS